MIPCVDIAVTVVVTVEAFSRHDTHSVLIKALACDRRLLKADCLASREVFVVDVDGVVLLDVEVVVDFDFEVVEVVTDLVVVVDVFMVVVATLLFAVTV